MSGAGDDWPSLGVVVPIYNEAPTIERACRSIAETMRGYQGRAAVIAVDDGSSDRSAAILEPLAAELDLLDFVHRPANGGYGAALRSGAERAAALELDFVAFIDSDLTNPPEDLLKIAGLARRGNDYIKGSRFIPGGGMAEVPFSRSVFSKTGNLVGRTLFGTSVRDVTNGFRGVRTELFLSWPLRETGFAVIVEEMGWALRSGARIAEFPTVLGARGEGQRGTAFAYSPQLFRSYLRYPMRFFGDRLRSATRRQSR